jgi:hypothetical protein
MFFKLEKMQKKDNTWKIKKQNFKTEKKQNNWEKMESQKGKKEEHGFVHLHFFCIYVAFSICFFPLLFCFFFAFCLEKNKIKAKKTNRKSKINANKMQMDKSIFSPFFPFLTCFFFSLFSPLILLSCFLDFADLLFVFSFFCFCRVFFQVLRKLE